MSRPVGPARLTGAIVALVLAGAIVAVAGLLTTGPAPPPAGKGGPGPDAERAIVLRVIDGDTLLVEIEGRRERVRYVGIDAPEIGSSVEGQTAECFAEEALAMHAGLVGGRELALERDVSDRDRFERLLRHAWVHDDGAWVHVGASLVAAGAARARSYPPDTDRDDLLQRAEQEARQASTGLWSECPAGSVAGRR